MSFFDPDQFPVFVSALILGVLIGLFFDLFKIKRMIFGENPAILFIDDLIFAFVSVIITVVFVFVSNNGIYRLYQFAALFCGFTVYRYTLSLLVIGFFKAVVGYVKGFLASFVFAPIRKLCLQFFAHTLRFAEKTKRRIAYFAYCQRTVRRARSGFRL